MATPGLETDIVLWILLVKEFCRLQKHTNYRSGIGSLQILFCIFLISWYFQRLICPVWKAYFVCIRFDFSERLCLTKVPLINIHIFHSSSSSTTAVADSLLHAILHQTNLLVCLKPKRSPNFHQPLLINEKAYNY